MVDSSAWVDFFSGRNTAAASTLMSLMGQEPLLVGDLMLCELLQGARSEAHARTLERELRRFQVVQMLDENIAVAAARNYRRLRDKGITVRKTVDLLIGTYCIVNHHRLLHADRDFDPMNEHLGLEVVASTLQVQEVR